MRNAQTGEPPDEAPELKKRLSSAKVIASVLVVGPLGIVTFGLSLVAITMGIGVLISGNPTGIVFVALGGLSCWFIYSLVVSLWLHRREASTVLGLIFGLIVLSVFILNIVSDASARVNSSNIWTLRDYSETFGLGVIFLNSWILTAFQIFRAAYPKRHTAVPGVGGLREFRKLTPRPAAPSADPKVKSSPSHHQMASLQPPSDGLGKKKETVLKRP